MVPRSPASPRAAPPTAVQASGVPLLAALSTVALAVGYGIVLGYAPEPPAPGPAVTFALYFAGLGAGVALAARSYPASAGVGVLAFAAVPILLPRIVGLPNGPGPIVEFATSGGVAFGVFLVAVGAETLLRRPDAVLSLLSARDTLLGAVAGAGLALATFLAWTPPETVYASLWVEVLDSVVVATRGLFLVASVLVPVLFLARRRVVTPLLLAGGVFGIAALGGGDGLTVWSATPTFLAVYGVLLLGLVLAAGLVELAIRGMLASLPRGPPFGPSWHS